ncbi:MerR family transcriptional regulator [Nocardioidaceae bacterium SCSIO 66511]|nr:MerR family transcriptional regulator [Nocardioidaceae bacterium SCSIO 66511]
MTEPLLTISAFARAVDLAPGTLRYYDEAGLLAPTEVDARTGYRYYTAELERRAHLIRRMREAGLPIETMRSVLDGSVDDAVDVLQEFAERAQTAAQRTQSAVADVIASLRSEAVANKPASATVDAGELAAALRRVLPAADTDTDSPLSVIALDITGEALSVVATDRYWLACWDLELFERTGDAHRFVVPRDRVQDSIAWLERRDTVQLAAADDTLRLTDPDGATTSVMLEPDRFPAYRLILDSALTCGGRATIGRAKLLAALGSDDATPVRLRFGGERVAVRQHDGAEGVRLPATTVGEPIELGFSPALLAKALRSMVGSDVTFSYDDGRRAVRVVSAEQRRLVALVMPMRLDSPK